MAIDHMRDPSRRLSLVPVVILLALTGAAAARARDAADLTGVRPVPAVALAIGGLIGELAHERAEAVRYAALRDSGRGFDLHPQWARTDAAVLALDELLEENGKQISPNVITKLERARKDLSAIERQRQSIEGFLLYNYQAYDYYSGVIDVLIGALAATAEMGDPAAKSVQIYAHAVQLREAASKERDLIMQVIGGAGRKVSDKTLTAIITAQQSHTDTLLQLVNPEQKQFARLQLSGPFLDNLASLQTQAFTAAKEGSFDPQLLSDWQRTQNQYLSRVVLVANRMGQDLRYEGTPGRGLASMAPLAVPSAAVAALLVVLLVLRSRRPAKVAVSAAAGPTASAVPDAARTLPASAPERPREEVVFSGRPSVSLTLVPQDESTGASERPRVDDITIRPPADLKEKIETAVSSFQSAEEALRFKKDDKV